MGDVDTSYVNKVEKDAKLRLGRAGVRLASLLNRALGSEQADWDTCQKKQDLAGSSWPSKEEPPTASLTPAEILRCAAARLLVDSRPMKSLIMPILRIFKQVQATSDR